MTLSGGCHCGAVRFKVNVTAPLSLLDCNCSICTMTGYLHLIVNRTDFALQSGANAMNDYRFNTGAARHLFCSKCGVKSHYIPRSHPDGVSVNARCLDKWPDLETEVEPYDGRDWEAARAKLKR
ncbi:GFA family protein [Pacificimonas sp. WHA3]|uniref:GFA family protein n=1 Tax=Pacificimonas pallii TaxID=2827236 RepID=A0ABS6SG63_9SPHN|nr:GFA family protein [Pacificimonas pallii]MBV7256817.1 GFA family protein [Pacificimonas pallii]